MENETDYVELEWKLTKMIYGLRKRKRWIRRLHFLDFATEMLAWRISVSRQATLFRVV